MSALGDYYNAQAAEARQKGLLDQTQGGLITAQTQELSGNDAATRGLQNAQAGLATASAGKTTAEAANVNANDAATRASQSASAGLTGAQTGLVGSQAANFGLDAAATRGLQGAQGAQDLSNAATTNQNLQDRQGLTQFDAKGSGKVPTLAEAKENAIQGKAPKPAASDTVPAMLTPGEAVLNKGAAEHYGSDVIDHMNKMGLMRMAAQSEVAKATGQSDPHAMPVVKSKAERAAAKKAPPVGPGGSKQPAGGAPQKAPGGGAVPGFAKGTGMVLPSYTPNDRAAIAGQQPQLDPTSYGLGVLHGASIGTTNPKDSSQKSA